MIDKVGDFIDGLFFVSRLCRNNNPYDGCVLPDGRSAFDAQLFQKHPLTVKSAAILDKMAFSVPLIV